MAGPSNYINLDSLIPELDEDEDKPLVLKITGSVENSHSDKDDNSGSDSSYGEFAKKVAQGLDKCIADLEMQEEEKTRRITAARLAKAKELEEKQKSFGRSKNPNKKASGKNMNSVKVEKVKKQTVKDKIPVKGNNLCKSVIKDVTRTSHADSKIKNITIQNFDVESTPSESEEETDLDLVQYEKVITGCLKRFTVKSLNRVKNDSSSSSVEDETTILNRDLPRFQCAEKSVAANRRRRSNYLKKRHSNFKKENSDRTKENPSCSNLIEDDLKMKNESLTLDNNSPKRQNKMNKIQSKERNYTPNSLKDNIQKGEGRNLKKQINNEEKFSKRSKKKNIKSLSNTNEPVRLLSKNRPLLLKNNNALSSTQKNDLSTTATNLSTDKKVVKIDSHSSSDDSIQIIKEVSLRDVKKEEVNDNKREFKFKFEQSPDSSENEIDWKGVEEMRKRNTSVSHNVVDSDEELNNDLMTIVQKHCKLVKDIPPVKRKDSSSSDFDAEFDSVLEKFNKMK